jgi:hypothetical protein
VRPSGAAISAEAAAWLLRWPPELRVHQSAVVNLIAASRDDSSHPPNPLPQPFLDEASPPRSRRAAACGRGPRVTHESPLVMMATQPVSSTHPRKCRVWHVSGVERD